MKSRPQFSASRIIKKDRAKVQDKKSLRKMKRDEKNPKKEEAEQPAA